MRRVAALLLLVTSCGRPPECAPADLAPEPGGGSFAVVSSDYASSAVALLDAEGRLVREAFLDSGTVPPQIVAALSGDVVLPSAPLGECTLVVVDRLGTDVLSFLDPCAGRWLAQVDVGSGFRANPQDVARLPGDRFLVSRHEPNGDPGSSRADRGNDLLILDGTPRVVSSVSLDVANTDDVLARPSRIAMVERGNTRRAVVGLARLSRDFRVAGSGAVALVDVDTSSVELVELGPLASCDDVDGVPDRADRVVVRCAGIPFSSDEERRESAGLVLLELTEGGALEEVGSWVARDHPDAPVYDAGSVPVGGSRVAAVAKGDLSRGIPDRVALIDLSSGETAPVFEAGGAFVVGEGAVHESLLLVPDAHLGAVRRFEVQGLGATELSPTITAPCRGLPPREVRRL